MAKEMHRADIYIGDLVQEGNMGLMLAMEDHADDTEALLSMAKESMQALLESQEETKKQDNRMVEKVNRTLMNRSKNFPMNSAEKSA